MFLVLVLLDALALPKNIVVCIKQKRNTRISLYSSVLLLHVEIGI